MERLQKVIAHSGICSRRKAEELITAGKVKVNGEVITTLGTKVSKKDEVMVNDKAIKKEPPVYYV
ncbi:MAG: S4 domain-containing protein, partial [Bacillota bacterium]